MILVGVTGGIGSGKTTVCKLFEIIGIPVFSADTEAKKLYTEDQSLQEELSGRYGKSIFEHNVLNRKKLASIIFSDPRELAWINAMVHPRIAKKSLEWAHSKQAPYGIHEAALLIESGFYKKCRFVIVVESEMQERLHRIQQRDGIPEVEIRKRFDAQMPPDLKTSYAHRLIRNSGDKLLIPQVMETHQWILSEIKKGS